MKTYRLHVENNGEYERYMHYKFRERSCKYQEGRGKE
jgi:hypothetical protein